MVVDVVIPALDEERSIGLVLADLQDERLRHVYVVDNGSTDRTAEVARKAGATVLREPERGYGAACLRGISEMRRTSPPDVIAFVDGDYSDHPEEITRILDRVEAGFDLVIGSRVLGDAEAGALLPQARFGNWLSTRLIEHFFDESFTDLGPFRAIRWEAYEELSMADRNFGWTVEMQVKAAIEGLSCDEVPVSYRQRIGHSKVTGTVKGSFLAGVKILWVIARETVMDGRRAK
jgi:glycosyltransferase involved in cell wall biosynthesis